MRELNVSMSRVSEALTDRSGDLKDAIVEARALLCHSETSNAEALAIAFGLVDEYLAVAWQDVIAEAFASYSEEQKGEDG